MKKLFKFLQGFFAQDLETEEPPSPSPQPKKKPDTGWVNIEKENRRRAAEPIRRENEGDDDQPFRI